MNDKWDIRFLRLAKEIASWSKDPSTKCGAILVLDRRIIATGYNGFPEAIEDNPELLNNRPEKYKRIIHAEMNALLDAGKSAKYATCYTWPDMPCERCAVHLIQAGINNVVYPQKDGEHIMKHWAEQFKVAKEVLDEAYVDYEGIEWQE